MKNLHKKIIAGALIGAISMGGVLSQGVQVFASSSRVIKFREGLSYLEEKWFDSYMRSASEHFGFVYSRVDPDDIEKYKESFENPGLFVQSLYEKGMKAGVNYYIIGGQYCSISSNKGVEAVGIFKAWDDGFPYFYSYINEKEDDLF